MACRRYAQSSTVRAIGPVWSSVHESVRTPARLTRPYVGLSPTMPQKAAGPRTDPPVSEPEAPRGIDGLGGNRNAEQRARVTAPQRLLGRARLGQGAVGRQGDEGAQGGVELLDPRQQRTRHLDG